MTLSPIDEQEIRSRVARMRDLPPLPIALQRLLEVIYNEVNSTEELESVINYDQALSVRILRIANSSYYGRRGSTHTLSRAMMLIGFEQVKYICLYALLTETFADRTPIDPDLREHLWKHAFTTARVASTMAEKRPWISRDEAFTLGLLHDLGRLVMAADFPDHYRMIATLSARRNIPTWCFETQYGMAPHTLVGKWVAVKWGLPEVYQDVMEFHHHPEKSPSSKVAVKLVSLANTLAHSSAHPELLTDEITLTHCRDLYITQDEWEEYSRRFLEIQSEVDQLWSLLK